MLSCERKFLCFGLWSSTGLCVRAGGGGRWEAAQMSYPFVPTHANTNLIALLGHMKAVCINAMFVLWIPLSLHHLYRYTGWIVQYSSFKCLFFFFSWKFSEEWSSSCTLHIVSFPPSLPPSLAGCHRNVARPPPPTSWASRSCSGVVCGLTAEGVQAVHMAKIHLVPRNNKTALNK